MTAAQVRFPRGEGYRRRRYDGTHRRPGVWRSLARPLASALFLVALPAAGATWALTSPRFALQEIDAQGSPHVSQAWIHAVLQPIAGRSLFRLSLEEVDRRISSHPWVATVAIRKELPHSLTVSVEEKMPVAILRHPAGLYFLDDQGRKIAAFEPGDEIGDLPLVSVRPGVVPQFEQVLEVYGILQTLAPEWAVTLGEIDVVSETDVRLFIASLPYPLLVTAEEFETALLALRRYLPMINYRYPELEAVDLRFGQQIVLQPAEFPQYKGG